MGQSIKNTLLQIRNFWLFDHQFHPTVKTDPWACKTCTTINERFRRKCMTCSMSKTGTTRTTLETPRATPRIARSWGNSGVEAQSAPVPPRWNCSRCTYLNERRAQQCSMCHQQRQPGDDVIQQDNQHEDEQDQDGEDQDQEQHQEQHDGGRTTFSCSACTFINPSGATRCEICMTPR